MFSEKWDVAMMAACMLFCSCAAQKNSVKIHAFKQPALQGANRVAIADENIGGPPKGDPPRVKLSASYMLYAESSAGSFEPKAVWLNKEGFPVKSELVTQTPVVINYRLGTEKKADTLVQKTDARVFLLKPVAGFLRDDATAIPAENELSAGVKKKIQDNELVVYCVVNGKPRYFTVKAIKKLPPLALQ